MELLEWQIVLVGFVATVLVQIIRLIGDKMGKPLSKRTIQWVVLVISIPLAVWWGALQFPALPVLTGDPVEIVGNLFAFIGLLVAMAGETLGVAFIVYNVLSKKIFDQLPALRL